MTISFEAVKKYYDGMTVLDGISLSVTEGETICFMGESGSGKTTIFRLIMGLEKPDDGNVVTDPDRVSAVFQENRLFDQMNPIKNIKAACDYRITREQIMSHLIQILPPECADKPVGLFSGGMKRRVAILRAVLADSDIMIMDEPFQGLDEDTRLQVIRYVKQYQADRTLIYSTHDPEEFRLLGGRQIILQMGGRIHANADDIGGS